ncbi:MAG: PDC sensor domain-containing protein, partial [Oceanidesulfovibrio sp.]
MGFRWKVFFIFLAFSLVPVVVVTFINHEVTDHTAALLSRGAAETMETVVRHNVVQMVSDLSEDVARSKSTLLFTVDVLAEDVRQTLAEPPARPPEAVYSLRDFRSPQRAPDDMAEASEYALPGQDHVMVSRGHPVFFYAGGEAIDQPDGVYPADVRAMAAAAPFMRRIFMTFPYIVYRVYVGLESGLHCSLPGHGEYPNAYDPRERFWYRRAVEAGEPVWTLPLRDASTSSLILTASAPIRDASGRIVGVAGLDVLDTVAMGGRQIVERWGAEARAFLVYPQHNPETGAMDLRVAASQPAVTPPRSEISDPIRRGTDMEHPWLDELDPQDKAALLESLDTNRPGA